DLACRLANADKLRSWHAQHLAGARRGRLPNPRLCERHAADLHEERGQRIIRRVRDEPGRTRLRRVVALLQRRQPTLSAAFRSEALWHAWLGDSPRGTAA